MNKEFWFGHPELAPIVVEQLEWGITKAALSGDAMAMDSLVRQYSHMKKYGSPCSKACDAAENMKEPEPWISLGGVMAASAGLVLINLVIAVIWLWPLWLTFSILLGVCAAGYMFVAAQKRNIKHLHDTFVRRQEEAIAHAHSQEGLDEDALPRRLGALLKAMVLLKLSRLRKQVTGLSKDQKQCKPDLQSLFGIIAMFELQYEKLGQLRKALVETNSGDRGRVVELERQLREELGMLRTRCRAAKERIDDLFSKLDDSPISTLHTVEDARIKLEPESLHRLTEQAMAYYKSMQGLMKQLDEGYRQVLAETFATIDINEQTPLLDIAERLLAQLTIFNMKANDLIVSWR